jgi:hypothetical protein
VSETAYPNKQRLACVNEYLEFLLSQYPAPDGEDEQEDPLILILVCCQKTLERRVAKRVPTIEWTNIQKWAVIEAEKMLDKIYDVTGEYYDAVADWNPTTTPQNMQQNLTGMLMAVQHELISDIAEARPTWQKNLNRLPMSSPKRCGQNTRKQQLSKPRSRAQRRAALAQRTALSPRNIQEHTAAECAKAIHRSKSSRSYSLRTNPALLTTVYVAPPPKKQEDTNG